LRAGEFAGLVRFQPPEPIVPRSATGGEPSAAEYPPGPSYKDNGHRETQKNRCYACSPHLEAKDVDYEFCQVWIGMTHSSLKRSTSNQGVWVPATGRVGEGS
jgi:hypothetical protein